MVHLVAKTHLDVGFTDLAARVVDRLRRVHHPRRAWPWRPSCGPGAAPSATCGPPARGWCTPTSSGPTPPGGPRPRRPSRPATWSGTPSPSPPTPSCCDVALVEAGLEVAARLDHRFGRRTVAAKITDVPGHTRGLVPLLAGAGVELLHIGVNPVATVPDVPSCFRWRSPDGSEVVVAYQAGGYGDLTEVPGCPDRLAFAHTGDNLGPRRSTTWWRRSPRCGSGCPAPRCGPRPSTPSPRPCGRCRGRPAGGHRRDRRHLDPRRGVGPAQGRRLPRAAARSAGRGWRRAWWRPTTPACAGSTRSSCSWPSTRGASTRRPTCPTGTVVPGRPARRSGRAGAP